MIIGLCGFAQSGKNTVGRILVEKYGFYELAFADALRQSLYNLNPKVEIYIDSQKQGFWEWLNGLPERRYTVEKRVKDIVDSIGWDKAKVQYPEIRRLLQNLGTEAGRDIHGYDCWTEILRKKIENSSHKNFVITDLRFPNEQEFIKNLGGFCIKVTRDSAVPKEIIHASEIPLENVDDEIINNGTLSELEEKVDYLIHLLTSRGI